MKTLVVAPHPDDELLGCGGLLLKRGEQGAEIGWLIITAISETNGWPKDAEATRNREIETVRAGVGYRVGKCLPTWFCSGRAR